MFQHLDSTIHLPIDKPMMVYDGECGFCKYWVIRWKKMSEDKINFQPFQNVYDRFTDIDKEHFKQAVRYIDLNGNIYSGPGAAYYTYFKRNKVKYLFKWYQEKIWFRKLNDKLYQFIAVNRSFIFKVCIKLIGENPKETKYYWIFYLITFIGLITLLGFLLTNI